MQEIWKDIADYIGFYQVSNMGNVRSVDRVLCDGRRLRGKNIKACGNPYLSVTLAKNGVSVSYRVHRLVAEAFIPNLNNLPCVNHKDENKQNNCVDNLEWCTYSYNNEYSDVVELASLAKLGKHLSEQHKKAMSDTLKKSSKIRAEKRKITMQKKYPDGIKQSAESNQKRSITLKGRPKSDTTKQKMRKPKSEIAKQHMSEAQKRAWVRRKLTNGKE